MFTTGQRVMFKEVPLRVIGTKRDGMIVCEDEKGDETTFTAEQLRGDRVPGETANYIVIDDPMTFNQTPAQLEQATAWFNKTMAKRGSDNCKVAIIMARLHHGDSIGQVVESTSEHGQQKQEPQPMSDVERCVHGYYRISGTHIGKNGLDNANARHMAAAVLQARDRVTFAELDRAHRMIRIFDPKQSQLR